MVGVGQSRTLRALPRDRSRRPVDEDLRFAWQMVEGGGGIAPADGEIVTFEAPQSPGLTKVKLTATQHDTHCSGEALITVTASLLSDSPARATETPGLPGYTFESAPGELWRSRFNEQENLVVINSGHRDFVFASRTKPLKLRYIVRLFAKQLVLHNFPGHKPEELLERLVELSLYAESKLR